MKGQLAESIKAQRSNELLELEKQMSRRYREEFLHKKVEVLFEEEKEIDGRQYQIGHTREYIKAAYPAQKNLSGQILTGEPTQLLESDILLFQP